ncbi:MAG TPA: type IV pilin protein [Hymenobacter sp.]
MITVAIVGVLAAVAYPAYTSSVLKGKRAQARTAIAELLQQQERFMTQRNCYMAFATVAGVSTAAVSAPCGFTATSPVPFKNFSGDSLAGAAYLLSADACPGAGGTPLTLQECIRVIASPRGADSQVGSLRMTSTGVKDCTAPGSTANAVATAPSPPNLCWP